MRILTPDQFANMSMDSAVSEWTLWQCKVPAEEQILPDVPNLEMLQMAPESSQRPPIDESRSGLVETIQKPLETGIGGLVGAGETAITMGRMLPGAMGGLMGGLSDIIAGRSVEDAKQTMADFMNVDVGGIKPFVYEPSSEEGKQMTQALMSALEPLGIPAQKVNEFLTELTGSPEIGFAGEIILDPLNLFGAVAALRKVSLPKKGEAAAVTAGAVAATQAQAATEEEFMDSIMSSEGWHGGVPRETSDLKESGTKNKSLDVGFGHKLTDQEKATGKIYGIPFKDKNGKYIELSKEQAREILAKDYAENTKIARKQWDQKLAAIGSSWDQIEEPYRQALSSLAYNVGGSRAGNEWTAVLSAAVDQDVVRFAKELRRQDNKKWTAGMDNRVAKDLYAAGLISSLSEVKSVLPLANKKSGIPQ